jgi:hypothetical protein
MKSGAFSSFPSKREEEKQKPSRAHALPQTRAPYVYGAARQGTSPTGSTGAHAAAVRTWSDAGLACLRRIAANGLHTPPCSPDVANE